MMRLFSDVIFRRSIAASRQQRCDPANGDAPVQALRLLRLHLEIILTVSLRHEVLERHIEFLA
jgi:hypothetical protein